MMGLLVNLLAGTFGDWLKNGAKLEQTKAEARAKAVSQGIPGWSDNFLVLVWSYPAIAGFIPIESVQVAASNGMATFSDYPDWYIAGFMGITGAVFGIDKLLKFKGR